MKRFSNDLLNELSNEYANKWVKAEELDWRSLRRAYRSGFLAAAKILNGEIRESSESSISLRELTMRSIIAFPESTEDLAWFEEGRTSEFMQRLLLQLGLGDIEIDDTERT